MLVRTKTGRILLLSAFDLAGTAEGVEEERHGGV